MCALLTQTNCLTDKVQVVLVLEPGIDPGKVLGAALADAAVDDANLDIVGHLGLGDEVHQGAARVTLARSHAAQLKIIQSVKGYTIGDTIGSIVLWKVTTKNLSSATKCKNLQYGPATC